MLVVHCGIVPVSWFFANRSYCEFRRVHANEATVQPAR
jgi:hypothetical protein